MLFFWGITSQVDAEQNFKTNHQLLLFSLQNFFQLHPTLRCCGVALEGHSFPFRSKKVIFPSRLILTQTYWTSYQNIKADISCCALSRRGQLRYINSSLFICNLSTQTTKPKSSLSPSQVDGIEIPHYLFTAVRFQVRVHMPQGNVF